MRANPGITSICLAFLFLVGSNASISQVNIGSVTDATFKSSRNSEDFEIPLKNPKPVKTGDLLTAYGEKSWFLLDLDVLGSLVMVTDGSLELVGTDAGLECRITGFVVFKDYEFTADDVQGSSLCSAWANPGIYDPNGTKYMIHAQGYQSSVFVFEGEVAVTRTEPEFQGLDPVIVHAGEWLLSREGMPIQKPQKFRRSDPGSGNSECIYSNCKITDDLRNPGEPPRRPPLPSPPLHPPGRR